VCVCVFLCLQVTLEFPAPDLPGDYNLVLYVMCDSYLGCDQEYEFNISVVADEDENES
jgi:pre-mRNA-splicing helicase BRR2